VVEVDIKVKKLIAVVSASTVLVVACSTAPQSATAPGIAGAQVDFSDSRVDADAYVAAPANEATVVAGYESAGQASLSSVLLEPAPGPTWEVTEGHVTIVGYDETQ
jgi:hypothetical protein